MTAPVATCAEVEALLEATADGQRPDRRALAAHFRTCPGCRRRWPEMPGLLEALAAGPPLEPPAWTRPAGAAVRPALRHRLGRGAMAAAALVLVALGSAWLVRPRAGDGSPAEPTAGVSPAVTSESGDSTGTIGAVATGRETVAPSGFLAQDTSGPRRLPGRPPVLMTVRYGPDGRQVSRRRAEVRRPGRTRILGD